ncbi:MAG TPA: trehalose-phosphatase [Vicinamibacterales bacterium]|nr:trehalose-phosphatase [Vicinamibacterales bacterium]
MQAEVVVQELAQRRRGRHLLLLFDFDGTLAPFNSDPDAVYLARDVAHLLGRLASTPHATLGIISGRRLPDLRRRLKIAGDVYLAGFHGLEIQAPAESFMHPAAAAATSTMQAIAATMRPHLAELPGVFIEDKLFSIALHYREAAPAVRVVAISRFMDAARDDVDAGRLRLLPGSCVVELLPGAAWHKGSALQWIRERIERLHGPTFTVYVGDDVTDEDAFRAVGPEGVTVSASERASGAEYSVNGPDGVKRLLHSLDGEEDHRRA